MSKRFTFLSEPASAGGPSRFQLPPHRARLLPAASSYCKHALESLTYRWRSCISSLRFAPGGSIILQVEEPKAATSFGLPPPRFLPRRYKPRNVGSWTGHLTFANDLIAALQPSLIVELGTHWGEAYFTFCQSVEELKLSCLCYAVDHWHGDEHAGLYGEEVFDEVNDYNNRYYRQFSYLLRRSFDDALSQFDDESIDLLHIDGLHTYDAVARDFRSWLPKVRSGGIILLHDITPRHEDFGVWKLWDEIKAEFPETFEFHHSWGLGILAKGHITRHSPLTELLFDSSPSAREDLRRHYVIYASHLENILGRFPLAAGRPAPGGGIPDIRVQAFPFGEQGYSEDTCQIRPLRPGVWETLTFDFRVPLGLGPIRIDPGAQPGFIEVGDILIHSGKPEDPAWESRASSAVRAITPAGSCVLPFSENTSFLLSRDDDPQFMIAIPPEISSPGRVTITLRIVPASRQTIDLFELCTSQLKQKIVAHEQQVTTLQRERERLTADLDATTRELTAKNEAVQLVLHETQQKLLVAEDALYQMHHSLSWKVTSPLRKIMALVRSGPRQPRR